MTPSFPSDNAYRYERVLLGFSPLGEEEALDAENHLRYITFVLGLFNKSLNNVVSITGDNAAVNLKLAKLIQQQNPSNFFVGCASHRLALAVKDLMKPYDCVI